MLHPGNRASYERGFTLIELMIVIVIIGVLAAISLPRLKEYQLKSRRSEATSALMEMAAQLEQYFMDNRTYTGDFTQLGYPEAASVTTTNGYYTITIDPAAPTYSFTLTAAPQGTQSDDTACGNFTLDNTGAKGHSGTAPGCW